MAGTRDRAAAFDVVGTSSRNARPSHNLAHYAGTVGLPAIVLVVLAVGTAKHFNGHHLWIFALAVAALFVARGVHLGRPVTAAHTATAAGTVLAALLIQATGHPVIALATLALSGLVLMWPTSSRPQPERLPSVHALVDRTVADPLAPFAMHSLKSYFFSADQSAVIGYHTRLGVAVVGGDPIGDPAHYPALVAQFQQFCRDRGWRIVVLGASEHRRDLWEAAVWPPLRAVPIGRDVVVEVGSFDMVGRRFRNLRQAVSRTRNAGLTTEVIAEANLPDELAAQLREIASQTHGGQAERGFSMILDHALDGRYPGMLIVLARDQDGVVQGFQRYAVAGRGTEISLDVPWRRKGAPNGIDERLSVAMIDYARDHGGKRVSLAFAAFPELFDEKDRGWLRQVMFNVIHLGDPLLALESLYRYLKKFHSLGDRRYALLSFRMLPIAAFALLTLEFVPHRKTD
ncbi:bifunctional lysylphosphatidylglycerol flippase/synthetase MprF [Rhodococcus spelaei]|uniref:bifunctional lysylphosphatidylglycerol flippase/synthetase MprF n=1 Tax=Rhodococcus spelaei TaxID=2546320 RepID=UPI001FE40C53|nr:phosphatidylglycerol lysyltransferase domain-containing protein [Rhodococcus spelaei]